MALEDPDKKPAMKPEELYTILIVAGFLVLYTVPTIILSIFHAGAWEYFTALTLFIISGMIFWHAGAILRD